MWILSKLRLCVVCFVFMWSLVAYRIFLTRIIRQLLEPSQPLVTVAPVILAMITALAAAGRRPVALARLLACGLWLLEAAAGRCGCPCGGCWGWWSHSCYLFPSSPPPSGAGSPSCRPRFCFAMWEFINTNEISFPKVVCQIEKSR